MNAVAAAAGGVALIWLVTRKKRRKPSPRPTGTVVEPTRPATGAEAQRLATIAELLEKWVSDTPTPGFFFELGPDDTINAVARDALNSIGPHNAFARTSYIHCLQSGKYNLGRYGTSAEALDFGGDMLVPGIGKGILAAFRARNADALALMRAGRYPRMTVDPSSGSPLPPPKGGDSYGMPWLPPIDAGSLAIGEPSCALFTWSDGSSTIDPPPELLSLLKD